MRKKEHKVVVWALLGGIALSAAFFPWGWLLRDDTPTKEKLAARLEEYRALRMKEDWAGVYQLTDPGQRKAMPLTEFLSFFAHGYIKLTSFQVKEVKIDAAKGTGTTVASTKAALVPERLPPQYRKGLKIGPEDNTTTEADLPLDWVWKDGNWYFRIDQEVTSGRSQGRTLAPVK